ncbi:hypothetical protein E0H26_18060 [Micromonospora zingiberis]|uniref:AtpZ/AtpI family protein n=1 Tax=Micromonospora zingiberis TaxID=2053011 RepID=A0A4R0GEN0_9ACTN|nr:hypothetical protein [Micromonospora zingiberis]TCB95714.1 hypothetical protein E0H26_18060 [Micromonospora zingiberis]
MADNPHHKSPGEYSSKGAAGAVLGYLFAGIVVWGFLGWLAGEFLGLPTGIGIAVGMMLGAAGAIYLIMKRLSA